MYVLRDIIKRVIKTDYVLYIKYCDRNTSMLYYIEY